MLAISTARSSVIMLSPSKFGVQAVAAHSHHAAKIIEAYA